MNVKEKLKELEAELQKLMLKSEKTNNLIIEALEYTTEDIEAANHIITLYAEMSAELGKMVKLSQQQVKLLSI